MNKTVKIVILSVIAALLIALLIWGVAARNMIFFPHERMQYGERQVSQGVSQTSFEAETQGIKNIRLDFVSEEIEVVVTNENKIRIEETSSSEIDEEDKMLCGVNGDTFVAESGQKNNWADFLDWGDFADIKVTLYLPASYENNLGLNTVSGTISAKSLNVSKLTAHTTSGSISINGSSADKLDLETLSGTVSVQGGSFGKVTADTVSGEVMADADRINDFNANTTSGGVSVSLNEMPAEVNIETVSGNATVKLPENDGFTLDYDTVSGSLNSDFALAHDMYKNGGGKISVNTVSGGINLIKR